jgi:4-amino-4-deoxychorismate lyase
MSDGIEMIYWFSGHLYQGREISLAVNDPAFLYGATVFTTLRIYGDSLEHPLTQWPAHQARLVQALGHFGWLTPDWPAVKQGAKALSKDHPVLRITCFPDGRELITGRSLAPDLAQMQTQGIGAWVAAGDRYRRSHPGYKTGNYLEAWLALQAARGQGAQEAILVDAQGQWLETSTGNLWGWAHGQWHTPGLGVDILPGITRQHLVEHLHQRCEPAKEIPWTPDVVQSFKVLAYSNSGVQVVPIHTVVCDRSKLEFNPQHPALEALRTAFAVD